MTIHTTCRRCHEPIETINGDLCGSCTQPYDMHSLAECSHAGTVEEYDSGLICEQGIQISWRKSVLGRRILAGERNFRPVACIGCREFILLPSCCHPIDRDDIL